MPGTFAHGFGVEPSNFVSLGALASLAYYFATGTHSSVPLLLGIGGGYLLACAINAALLPKWLDHRRAERKDG